MPSLPSPIQGKGYYLWQVKRTLGGDPNAIAEAAKQAGLTHLLIKVVDGIYNYNVIGGRDLVAPLVAALRARGIQPWGWQYIYGNDPEEEAQKAVARVQQLGLDGFVVNAEVQFKARGMDLVARKYMQELRRGLSQLPIGLSTFRYPSVHSGFPFSVFLEYCDLNFPQVYWVSAFNPAQQLQKSYREYQSIRPWRTFIPTGAAYAEGNWSATPEQVVAFLRAARELQLPAANFWEWHTAYTNSALWRAVQNFNWPAGVSDSPPTTSPPITPAPTTPAPTPAPDPDIEARFIAAMNTGDPNKVALLYEKTNSKHVDRNHPRQVHQGRQAIYAWYKQLLTDVMPLARFSIIKKRVDGDNHYLNWRARTFDKIEAKGKDWVLMSKENPDLIETHYTMLSVQER